MNLETMLCARSFSRNSEIPKSKTINTLQPTSSLRLAVAWWEGPCAVATRFHLPSLRWLFPMKKGDARMWCG